MFPIMVIPHLILSRSPGQLVPLENDSPRILLLCLLRRRWADLRVPIVLFLVYRHPFADGRETSNELRLARAETIDSDPVFPGVVGRGGPGEPDRLADVVAWGLGARGGGEVERVAGGVVGGDVVGNSPEV
jgi:hypothetical protein